METLQLCGLVRETAYSLHRYLGHGFLEKVYENALCGRLRRQGLKVLQQHPVAVFDEDGSLIGDYFVDLLVEESLVVELKASHALCDEHIAQVLGYLKATRREHGLLINFGSYRFELRKLVMRHGSGSENGRKERKEAGGTGEAGGAAGEGLGQG